MLWSKSSIINIKNVISISYKIFGFANIFKKNFAENFHEETMRHFFMRLNCIGLIFCILKTKIGQYLKLGKRLWNVTTTSRLNQYDMKRLIGITLMLHVNELSKFDVNWFKFNNKNSKITSKGTKRRAVLITVVFIANFELPSH